MAIPQSTTRADTASEILDTAERLVQTRGFNGFSYADIAAELAITKAALHYHFATKAELGRSLIDRYGERFAEALAAIDDRSEPAPGRLAAYCEIYRGVLSAGRMCLCGMLASEYTTLPAPMQSAITDFFDRNREWLTALLDDGRRAGSLGFEGPPERAADAIVASLEGAMLIARPQDDSAILESVIDRLLAGFRATVPNSRG